MYSINEVIQLKVRDNPDDDELNKGIEGFTMLDQFVDTELNLNLIFSDTDAITTMIREPDILDVEIIMPQVFIDAENLEPLDKQESLVSIDLKPQMTKLAFEQLLEMAGNAA